VTISRGVAFGADRASAIAEATAAAEASYRMYNTWDMQEDTMVKINISDDAKLDDWVVAGNGDDCAEGFAKLAEQSVDYVGATFYNMPKGLDARRDYLQAFSENVIKKMA
jgi:hypothetical protein